MDKHDKHIDAFMRKEAPKPRPSFTDDTLRRVRLEAAAPRPRRLRWQWLGLTGALAACALAVALWLRSEKTDTQAPYVLNEVEALEYKELVDIEEDLILLAGLSEVEDWKTLNEYLQ